MSKLQTLIEQTEFLLAKQKEAQQECSAIFKDLLAATREKLNQSKDNRQALEHLEQVYTLIEEQSERLSEDAQVDIDFLSEQHHALKKIQEVSDPEKRQELLSMLIDDEEEIKDTTTFKKEVSEESGVSRQNLLAMVSDIKAAIKEGSAQDVADYLENMLDLDEESDSDEEDDSDYGDGEEDSCCDEDEDDDACGDSCSCGLGDGSGKCSCKKDLAPKANRGCGGCKGCSAGGCGSGCGSKGIDIFAELKMYGHDTHNDPSDKISH